MARISPVGHRAGGAAVVLAALVLLAGCGAVFAGPEETATSPAGTTDGTTTPDATTDPGGDMGQTAAADRFQQVSRTAGVDFAPQGEQAIPAGTGYGAVLVGDYDGDYRQDLLLIGGELRLYHNDGGHFERSDALPELPGLSETTVKSGLFLDYDNDGDQDLFLLAVDHRPFLLEYRDGAFHHRPDAFGQPLAWGTAVSAADYDGDGCLDLFVGQNGNWHQDVPDRGAGRPLEDGDNGNPNYLYRGDCEGGFDRVTDAGITGERWTLAVSFVDLTGDGHPDIHVGNDYNRDVLYVNQGDGTFVRSELPNSNRHAMASEVADVNGDGLLDVFVTNIEFEAENVWLLQDAIGNVNRGNNLYVNQGDGTFADEATDYGVRVPDGWGWSGNLVDLDNDGDLDLVHALKNYRRLGTGDSGRHQPVLVQTPPALWLRDGEDFLRQNATVAGLGTQDGRGLAALDYDADGDRDVLVSNISGPFQLYQNRWHEQGDAGNHLQVVVEGGEGTPIGAEVRATTAAGTQLRVMNSKANFFSQNPRVLHFGLGDASTVEELRVTWPDGTERTFEDVTANRRVAVTPDGVRTVAGGGN